MIEFSERLSYFGLATNLIICLTRVLHQEVKTTAKNVNYWQGITTLLPLFGGFIADAYLGRFSTVLFSSVIYILVVPHITDAIKIWIESVSSIPVDGGIGPADVCVIELGGTVGDIESMPFIEAIHQLSFSVGKLGAR